MNRAAAITRVKRGLGFRSDLDDEIASALQEAQRLLERGRTLPYFLLQESQNFAVTSGSAEISLPTGFLREKEDERFYYSNSDDELIFLEKLAFDIIKGRFPDTVEDGAPLAYCIRKSTVLIKPDRDTSYTLIWSYYKAADALTSNIENAWLEEEYGAPEVLIGKAGMILSEDLGDAIALGRFTKMFSEGWAGMLSDDIERQAVGRPLNIGARL